MSNQIARNQDTIYVDEDDQLIRQTNWILQATQTVGNAPAVGIPILFDQLIGTDGLSDRIFHAIGGQVFQVLKAGTYWLTGNITFQSPPLPSPVGSREVWVLINNDSIQRSNQTITAVSTTNSLQINGIYKLEENDEFEIRVFQDQGVSQDLFGRSVDTSRYCQLSITYIG